MNDDVKQEFLEDEEDTQKGRFLTFMIEEISYGIEVMYVKEIIGIQPITEVPEIPEYVKGIVNLRGNIIPVMDVRLRFKKQALEYNDRTCIIVVEVQDMLVGLIVDRVSDVVLINDADIVSPPEFNNINNRYIKGIGKMANDVKLILDCDKLLNDDDMEALTKRI
ncbi:chemotaxis protein CheW [Inconstantimicrobium mannanitabidum]|uniref:Chemotaxis protein CheW n=1 Tax=Inconstantimicrobium mannanitabidum TaxID=1604901 RepID=A0ACB5RHI1_9CLOT|nr:chemotaxis protein CheW [Clostridium sp. TW13]GKX68566.1 chemotaxis protein CheW [Clostridium sp. TW13]